MYTTSYLYCFTIGQARYKNYTFKRELLYITVTYYFSIHKKNYFPKECTSILINLCATIKSLLYKIFIVSFSFLNKYYIFLFFLIYTLSSYILSFFFIFFFIHFFYI